MKSFVWSVAAAVAAVASLGAQETVSPLAVQFGMGFTQGVGHTGRNLDTGWNTSIGAGYNFNRYASALVNFRTSVLGNTATTGFFPGAGGSLSVFSTTLDPVFHLMPGGHVDPYITGGGGVFRRSFGGNYSLLQPGVDVGVGLSFGTRWHGKLFAEARYEHVFTADHFYNNFLPVTFGYRW